MYWIGTSVIDASLDNVVVATSLLTLLRGNKSGHSIAIWSEKPTIWHKIPGTSWEGYDDGARVRVIILYALA